jgi:hypothetical protein
MRITRKFLRQQKSGLVKRLNELCAMADTNKLPAELKRMFPDSDDTGIVSHGELIRRGMQWAIEAAFPEHILS